MNSGVAARPSNNEIIEALGGAICGQQIVSVSRRRPYRYATSHPLEELQLALGNGRSTTLILKDLSWDRLADDARLSKPDFLYEPRREIDTYLRILGPAGIGPRCYAAAHDVPGSGSWLILEKPSGVELWQVGEIALWESAAHWIANLHGRFLDGTADPASLNPHLLRYDAEWFSSWATRAKNAIVGSADRRSREFLYLLERYDEIASRLAELPKTIVHGEYYPSNILVSVDTDRPHVWPVDWEMAAVGPGLLDTAALVSGWGRAERERLVAAYRLQIMEQGIAIGSMDEILDAVSMCQFHFALQWLGWSQNWRPPAEHARDWVGEALCSARELSLL